MPGLSMDPLLEPCSHSSPRSAEKDDPSDSEWRPRPERGARRRQRNRDAARKSRQKTTERADQLHQELQRLERDNSSLQTEISALQRDRDYYSSVLETHTPHCCLHKNLTDSTDAPSPVPPPTSHNVPAPATSALQTQPLKSHVPTAASTSASTHCLDQHKTSHSVLTPVPVPPSPPLNLHPNLSCPVSVPSLSLHSTSSPGLLSLSVPTPIHTSSKVPDLSTSPSPSSQLQGQLTPCQTFPVRPQMSHKVPIPSASCLGLHTPIQALSHTFPTPVPTPAPTPAPTPVPTSSSGPLGASVPLSLGPAVDTLLSDSSLDLGLFTDPIADPALVQFLEDNDWILNIQ